MYEGDPQLLNPLKRPVVLALYKAIKEMGMAHIVKHAEQYEKELERERVEGR